MIYSVIYMLQAHDATPAAASNGKHTIIRDITNTHNSGPKELKRQSERERYSQNRDEILKKQRQAYSQKKMTAASTEINGQGNETQTPVSITIDPNPKEIRRQRDRERYAQNRDEILKRQRQYRELEKASNALLGNDDSATPTPATGISVVTQLPTITCLEPNPHLSRVMESQLSNILNLPTQSCILEKDDVGHGCGSNQPNETTCADEESDWLHRNDRFQMQYIGGRMRPVNLPIPTSHGDAPMDSYNGNDHGEDEDAYGILEPHGNTSNIDDCLGDENLREAAYVEPDEEARLFAEQDVDFQSYRVQRQQANAVPNDDTYDNVYKNIPNRHHVLRKVPDCRHCGALRFPFEGPAFCCRKGKVSLVTPVVPEELKRLFISQEDDDAKYFRDNIRYFNSHFSFTSLGVTLDRRVSTAARTGVYTFRACGGLYHSLDNLVSADQRRYNVPTTSQVAAIWVEGSDPQNCFDRSVVVHAKGDRPLYIRAYYGCYDPLSYPLFFPRGETGWNRWMPYADPPTDTTQGSADKFARQQTQFSDLLTDEISIIDQVAEFLPRGDHATEFPADNNIMQEPNGNYAVHEDQATDLPEDDNEDNPDDDFGDDEVNATQSRKFVSAREYYCFKMQVRKKLFNIILFGGRLFQQWAVDMYIKIETMRLDWYSKPENQKVICADLYQGLVDTVIAGESRGDRIGKRIVLPRTFPGGDRDMQRRFLDAMAIVQRWGKPDYFITMTCNPYWEEITEKLLPGQLPQDRPDLVARVFKAKQRDMMELLTKASFA
uniref:Uncharacterized protein n=1 Tax=Avena sativa TaxID=4498 RepID=A0ACD6A2F0_AVESA